jgi:hypothetical protein
MNQYMYEDTRDKVEAIINDSICPAMGTFDLFHNIIVWGTPAEDSASIQTPFPERIRGYACSGKFVAKKNEFRFIHPKCDKVDFSNNALHIVNGDGDELIFPMDELVKDILNCDISVRDNSFGFVWLLQRVHGKP